MPVIECDRSGDRYVVEVCGRVWTLTALELSQAYAACRIADPAAQEEVADSLAGTMRLSLRAESVARALVGDIRPEDLPAWTESLDSEPLRWPQGAME